jgi:hypothetical protein
MGPRAGQRLFKWYSERAGGDAPLVEWNRS